MPVNVKCPTCGNVCRLADDAQEPEVLCPSCRSFFPRASQAAPSLLGRTPRVESSPPPAPTPQNRTLLAQPEAMIRYTCPRCKKSLESPASFAGQKLNCPSCSQRLQIPQPSTPLPAPVNKTILATEEPAAAVPSAPIPPPQPTSPPAVRPIDTLAVVEDEPSRRVTEPAPRRESCLECGENITGRTRVQTCSDCGSSFCSAACYREHRYYSHSRRRKKKRRPQRVECPYCDSTERPRSAWVISQSGWIVFIIVLLLFFFPLCWLGLLMTEPEYRCSDCGAKLS